ncbi:ligand-gated ionic channel-like [Tropilaelaps mercedesae]|uniref:Ligand-gated ionic channel-like n=1 Tax=Tropilaelaps mercedesae TaxID=418985 RepID=A0A1V9X917_9ACAR|nr:ligand-gated ionic channel-like [Tropilaelaps mercedesae]
MRHVADNLASSLSFEYVIEAPEDGEWGVKTENNWTGMIGMIYNNRSDVALGPLALTENRLPVVKFGGIVMVDYLTILTGYLSRAEPSAFGALMTFDWTVWLTVVASISTISLLSLLFERNSTPEKVSNLDKCMERFYHYFETYLKAMLAESATEMPQTNALRVLSQMWWMGAIVLMNAFTGHMKAMMMVKPEPTRIDSMAMLAKKDMPVFLWKGTSYETRVKNSTSPHDKKVYSLVEKYHGAMSIDDMFCKRNMRQVIRGQGAIVSDIVVLKYQMALNCREVMSVGNYYIGTDDFYPHTLSLAFHNNFPESVRKEMDKRVRWMVELGLINQWLYSHYDNLDECAAMAKAGEPPEALDLEKIQSALLVWFIGVLLSILLMFVESGRTIICCFFCYSLGKKLQQMLLPCRRKRQSHSKQAKKPTPSGDRPKILVAVSPYIDDYYRTST